MSAARGRTPGRCPTPPQPAGQRAATSEVPQQPATPHGPPASVATSELIILGLVSALTIALQIVLIRALSIASHHHFVYLVISTALLGFGASGTLISILKDRVDRHFPLISLSALAAFAISPWALRAASAIPVDLFFILFHAVEALRLWAVSLIMTVPFFAAGLFIGVMLRARRGRIGPTYAANLVGSGLGGLGVLPFLGVVSPESIITGIGATAAVLAVVWVVMIRIDRPLPAAARATVRGGAVSAVAAVGSVVLAIAAAAAGAAIPWQMPIDQYKGLAYVRELERQGDAEYIAGATSAVSRVDIYEAPSIHFTLFASPGAPGAPPQVAVFRDGFQTGAFFRIASPDEAPILEWLPQSLPYAVLDEPDVLILGETDGTNVWLALAMGARSVTVVCDDTALVRLLSDDLFDHGGEVFADPRVTVITGNARTMLAALESDYDLIQLAAAEAVPAASAGLVSLQEDYLLTTEAIELALNHLRPGGLIAVTRGLQSPARDNPRLFALFAEAARRSGRDPADHLVQARNYLAATTILSRDPIPGPTTASLVIRAHELVMDVDYFPGIAASDLTTFNVVDGPVGQTGATAPAGSSYYRLAMALIGRGGDVDERFLSGWLYETDPPTDNRPYFHNFFRLGSLSDYIETYGNVWFSGMELGPVVVAATLLQAIVAGVILILVPVLVVRARRRRLSAVVPEAGPRSDAGTTPTAWTVLHFGAIGLGFMMFEMLAVQKATLVLGEPVYSAAAVITALLVFAGLGSTTQSRLGLPAGRRIMVASIAVLILGPATVLALNAIAVPLATGTFAARLAVTILVLAPLSFSCGWLFPAGMDVLSSRGGEPGLALAVNGVASVVAAPLAVLVSASFGFIVLAGLALLCYVVAGIAAAPVRLGEPRF